MSLYLKVFLSYQCYGSFSFNGISQIINSLDYPNVHSCIGKLIVYPSIPSLSRISCLKYQLPPPGKNSEVKQSFQPRSDDVKYIIFTIIIRCESGWYINIQVIKNFYSQCI